MFFSSAWQVVEEQVGGVTKVQYVWSPEAADTLVERDRDADGNPANGLEERLYVQQDAVGNVTALVGAAGAVLERYTYDPYGAVTVRNASWAVLGASAYASIYLYQAGRSDPRSGLVNFRNRDYSPSLGRWLEVDPAGYGAGDNNLYREVGNNPTNATDPSGLVGWWEQVKIVGGYFWRSPGDAAYNAALGANYGSAVNLQEITGGHFPGAQSYIQEHQAEFGPTTTMICQGTGIVAREAGIAALTAGLGNAVAAGRLTGNALTAARVGQGALTAREGYQTIESARATVQAYQQGDRTGVILNGVSTVLAGVGTAGGLQSLCRSRAAAEAAVVAAAPKSVTISERNLQKVFSKHGDDFGLSGNWNPSRSADVRNVILNHINSSSVQRINGTYRGMKVIHVVDPKTGLNVILDEGGNLIGGWKLSIDQLQSVLSGGKLF